MNVIAVLFYLKYQLDNIKKKTALDVNGSHMHMHIHYHMLASEAYK